MSDPGVERQVNILDGLDEVLECQYGLLTEINAKGVLTDRQIAEIQRPQSTVYEQNNKLIEFIRPLLTDYNKYPLIIASLEATGQRHVAKQISGNIDSSDGDRPMTAEERARITANAVFLMDCLDINNTHLLEKLHATNVITSYHLQSIKNQERGYRQIEELLRILKRRSFVQFREFVSCLSVTGQEHVRHVFDTKYGVLLPVDVPVDEEMEVELIQTFRRMTSMEKRRFLEKARNVPGVELVHLQGHHSIRLYFLCHSLEALQALHGLAESDQLVLMIESLFNSLLSKTKFTPIHLQGIHLVDYNKYKQYFIECSCTGVTLSDKKHVRSSTLSSNDIPVQESPVLQSSSSNRLQEPGMEHFGRLSLHEPRRSVNKMVEVLIHNVPEKMNQLDALKKIFGPLVNIVIDQQPNVSALSSAESFEDSFGFGPTITAKVSDVRYSLPLPFHNWLQRTWCESISRYKQPSLSCMWMEIQQFNTGITDIKSLESPVHKFVVTSMSFGAFSSPGIYISHWQKISKSNSKKTVSFEFDTGKVTVSWPKEHKSIGMVETNFENLDKHVIVQYNSYSSADLYIFLKSPVKVFKGRERLDQEDHSLDIRQILKRDELGNAPTDDFRNSLNLKREVKFSNCTSTVIGSSNVLKLQITLNESIQSLLQKLSKQKVVPLFASPDIHDRINSTPIVPNLRTFDATYAWYCLLSCGFKVVDQMTRDFLSDIDIISDDSLTEMLFDVVSLVSTRSICNLRQILKLSVCGRANAKQASVDDASNTPAASASDDDEKLRERYAYVRRVILTPTATRYVRPQWTGSNRVIRQFNPDNFIQISIRDEDFGYISSSPGNHTSPINEMMKILKHGITIGVGSLQRRYKYLGSSNSQLREHGMWMYASDGHHTVESIRDWMGDLSSERCVATFIARLGQCFSTSQDTVVVDDWERIQDKEFNNYTFTDGIGKISPGLAKMISSKLRLKIVPSAFQIRFGGCKGVVAVAPELGETAKIQIRKSMEKFSCQHRNLEVMQFTKPGRLYLNRQVITILSGLGVPDSAFFALQDPMLQRLADIFVHEDAAYAAIAGVDVGISQAALKNSPITLTLEPFFRSVLHLEYQQRFLDLLNKTHIEVPTDKGRSMMGTVDEYNVLQYGEVFIQYSVNIDQPQAQTCVLEGSVVVAKNPCFHPGDVRKFTAVNKPNLAHMIDCIVFPATGERPHPDEMSGSDLDGDMYFVCWEDSLIPPGNNEAPMDYTKEKERKEKFGGATFPKEDKYVAAPITVSDMINFIGQFIQSATLGVIANAHLVYADAREKGIFSDQCLKLAQLHSDAVDFPKTGKCPTPGSLAGLRPSRYPHFMEKTDKEVYISDRIVAKLYDQCQRVAQVMNNDSADCIEVDSDFEVLGYSNYIDQATILRDIYVRDVTRLMDDYGLDSEMQVLSAKILKTNSQRGIISKDISSSTEILKLQSDRLKRNVKELFYEEFGDQKSPNNANIQMKASALYYVTYRSLSKKKSKNLMYGLPWLFLDVLVAIKTAKLDHMADRSGVELKNDFQVSTWKSLLQKHSHSISSTDWSSKLNWKAEVKKRLEIYSNVKVTIVSQRNDVNVALFGLTLTTIANVWSSVDILVMNQDYSPISQEKFDEVILLIHKEKPVISGENRKPISSTKRTFHHYNDDDAPGLGIKVTIHNDVKYLRRTAYIIAAMCSNKWMIPGLKFVVAWACNDDGAMKLCTVDNSLLTVEELVLMFFFATLHINKLGATVCEAHVQRVTMLLLENHFQERLVATCDGVDCISSAMAEVVAPAHDDVDNHKMESTVGETVLLFFRYYSSRRDVCLELYSNVSDLSALVQTRLLKLKGEQCIQISDRMIQAYHLFAQSISVTGFLSYDKTEDHHLVLNLPHQLSLYIGYAMKHFETKLKAKSGAISLTIRVKKLRNETVCLCLEAWGDSLAMMKLNQNIQDLTRTALMMMRKGDSQPCKAVVDAFHVVLEGCTSPDDMVIFPSYRGPCQRHHEKKYLKRCVPRLIKPNLHDEYFVNKFVNSFRQQINFIKQTFDKSHDGDIAVVVSYGTYYVVNNSSQFRDELRMSEAEFCNRQRSLAGNDRLVDNTKPPLTQDRTRHGVQFESSAFIPSRSSNEKQLNLFLNNNNFVKTEDIEEYRVTIRLHILQGTTDRHVLILDKDLNFHQWQMPSVNWLNLDTVRGNAYCGDSGGKCLNDMRFKINSRSDTSNIAVLDSLGCADILNDANKILSRKRQSGVIEVWDKYRDSVTFLRHKKVKQYECCVKSHLVENTEDSFLNQIKIKVSCVNEYSFLAKKGTFSSVDLDRVEVTFVAPVPDLNDSDLCEKYIKWLWQFGRDFGTVLI